MYSREKHAVSIVIRTNFETHDTHSVYEYIQHHLKMTGFYREGLDLKFFFAYNECDHLANNEIKIIVSENYTEDVGLMLDYEAEFAGTLMNIIIFAVESLLPVGEKVVIKEFRTNALIEGNVELDRLNNITNVVCGFENI